LSPCGETILPIINQSSVIVFPCQDLQKEILTHNILSICSKASSAAARSASFLLEKFRRL